jgi:hypothetical protein
MTKRERLEDLGRIYETLDLLIEDDFFEYLCSKHEFEEWMKKHFKAYKNTDEESLLDSEFYEMHLQLRHLKEKLLELWTIGRGEDE